MTRSFRRILLLLFCFACSAPGLLAPAFVASSWAGEEHEGGEPKAKAEQLPGPKLPGLRHVPMKKAPVAASRPFVADGIKGVENFCGAVAASAASTRLAWQETRVKALQAEMVVKTAELAAKEAEVRSWVDKREQLLAKAGTDLTAIYAKMKPDAAAAQLQAMDDDTAAALLLKLKPAVASAVMGEMDPTRAARLSDLLTGAAPKSDGNKS